MPRARSPHRVFPKAADTPAGRPQPLIHGQANDTLTLKAACKRQQKCKPLSGASVRITTSANQVAIATELGDKEAVAAIIAIAEARALSVDDFKDLIAVVTGLNQTSPP